MNVLVFSARARFLIISALFLGGITVGMTQPAQADALDDARQYMQDGRDGQATALLEAWVADHATDYEAVFLLGMAYAQQEKYTKAIEMFHQVSALHPELAEPHGNLAVIYNALDRPRAAARELEIFLERKPGDPVIHENLGDIHVQLALRNYQIALARTKNPILLKKYQRLLRFTESQNSRLQNSETSRIDADIRPVGRVPEISAQRPFTSQISLSGPVIMEPVKPDEENAVDNITDGSSREGLIIPPISPELQAGGQDDNSPTDEHAASAVAQVEPNTSGGQHDVHEETLIHSDEAEVVKAVDRWRAAWAAKDLAGYFDSYAADFRPLQPGLNGDSRELLAGWKQYKIRVISKKTYIHITLNKMQVNIAGHGNRAIVRFLQFFDSNNYSSQDDKQIIMMKGAHGWKIVEERVL